MSKLPLTFACGPYDRMEALNYGLIDVEGIDLNFLKSRRQGKSSTAWSARRNSICRKCRSPSMSP